MAPRRKPVAPHATQSLIVSAGPIDPDVAPVPLEPRGRLGLESGGCDRVVAVARRRSGAYRGEATEHRRAPSRNRSRSATAARRISIASRSAAAISRPRSSSALRRARLRGSLLPIRPGQSACESGRACRRCFVELPFEPVDLVGELRGSRRRRRPRAVRVLEPRLLADRLRVAARPLEQVGGFGFGAGQELGGVDGDRLARPLGRLDVRARRFERVAGRAQLAASVRRQLAGRCQLAAGAARARRDRGRASSRSRSRRASSSPSSFRAVVSSWRDGFELAADVSGLSACRRASASSASIASACSSSAFDGSARGLELGAQCQHLGTRRVELGSQLERVDACGVELAACSIEVAVWAVISASSSVDRGAGLLQLRRALAARLASSSAIVSSAVGAISFAFPRMPARGRRRWLRARRCDRDWSTSERSISSAFGVGSGDRLLELGRRGRGPASRSACASSRSLTRSTTVDSSSADRASNATSSAWARSTSACMRSARASALIHRSTISSSRSGAASAPTARELPPAPAVSGRASRRRPRLRALAQPRLPPAEPPSRSQLAASSKVGTASSSTSSIAGVAASVCPVGLVGDFGFGDLGFATSGSGAGLGGFGPVAWSSDATTGRRGFGSAAIRLRWVARNSRAASSGSSLGSMPISASISAIRAIVSALRSVLRRRRRSVWRPYTVANSSNVAKPSMCSASLSSVTASCNPAARDRRREHAVRASSGVDRRPRANDRSRPPAPARAPARRVGGGGRGAHSSIASRRSWSRAHRRRRSRRCRPLRAGASLGVRALGVRDRVGVDEVRRLVPRRSLGRAARHRARRRAGREVLRLRRSAQTALRSLSLRRNLRARS